VELEVSELPWASEVVDDEEAAFEQVVAQAPDLLLRRSPRPDLDDVGDGVLEEARVVEREDVRTVGEGTDERRLVDDSQEVVLGARVVVRPGGLAPATPPEAESAAAIRAERSLRRGRPLRGVQR
jgi:hypothetical protein